MTVRQLYESVLIELNKENASNILLEDFNYFANKAVNNYVNKKYNIYDINQQTTDDLRVLKGSAKLKPIHVDDYDGLTTLESGKMATYEIIMPSDYLHLLNCICFYKVNKTYKCYNKNDTWRAPATRLTADMYSKVLDNFWNKPSYKNPYYYIHNVNTVNDLANNTAHEGNNSLPSSAGYSVTHATVPTNPVNNGSGTDGTVTYTYQSENLGNDGNNNSIYTSEGLPRTINIDGLEASNVERGSAIRYGNVSEVRVEIRYGTDNSVFELTDVYVDYIKVPLNIRLTQFEIDKTEDVSSILEFPDYVCQEIINELVHLIMEHDSNLRLQTHPVVSLSIANPAQALAPEAAGQSAQ